VDTFIILKSIKYLLVLMLGTWKQNMSTKVSSKVELDEKLSILSIFDTPIIEPEETQPNVPI
jgi:hypothetical protein